MAKNNKGYLSENFIEYLINRMKEVFPTKQELDEKLDEKIKHLPTKDEFYESEVKIMKRLDGIEQNTTVMGSQVSENRDRVEKLEERVFKN